MTIAILCSSPVKEAYSPASLLNTQTSSNIKSIVNNSDPLISEILYGLGNLYSFLDQNFLYEIDTNKVKESLTKALVDSLGDKYSYYISGNESENYQNDYEGEYVGIGTYLIKMNPAYADPTKKETYMVIITSPFPGGPADRAGLRANDMISHINGEDISALDGNEASKKLRGKEGEEITITVHRGDSVFDLTLTPEHVIIPTVVSGMLEDGIAYMQILEFANTTSQRVKEDLEKLEGLGMKALIIDLRNNTGGSVQPALEIADYLLEGGNIVSVKYKENSGNASTLYAASQDTLIDTSIPIALLVNGGTASASEILTAALCENGRAFSIGDTTFGKGIMQSVIPYGDGFIQFTSANYYTPNGSSIHEIGITPDILMEEVEFSEEEIEAYEMFMQEDKLAPFREENPEYTKENIDKFAEENKDSGVPELLLKNLMTKEYIYSMEIDERPLVDMYYDEVLLRALEELRNQI